MGDTRTDEEGSFSIRLEGVAEGQPFRLYQTTHERLGQDATVHRVGAEEELRVVLPWGAVRALVLDEEGLPVDGLPVLALLHPAPGPDREERGRILRSRSREGGHVRFFYDEGTYASLATTDWKSGAAARVEDLYLDPALPTPEVVLRLSMVDRYGAVRIEVTDRVGHPILAFAARLEAPGTLEERRLVYSEAFEGGGYVEGLPTGLVEVSLAPRYVHPPHLYDSDQAPKKQVEVLPGEVRTVSFQIQPLARAAFELELPAEPGSYRFLMRRPEEEAWRELRDLWLFHEDGGVTRSLSVSAAGRFYSRVLEPGSIAFEVRPHLSDEVLWSGEAFLQPGSVREFDVDLND